METVEPLVQGWHRVEFSVTLGIGNGRFASCARQVTNRGQYCIWDQHLYFVVI